MSFFRKLRLFFVPRSWGLHFIIGKPVVCEDGHVRDCYVMRRRDGDRIVYRGLTDDEQRDNELFLAIK